MNNTSKKITLNHTPLIQSKPFKKNSNPLELLTKIEDFCTLQPATCHCTPTLHLTKNYALLYHNSRECLNKKNLSERKITPHNLINNTALRKNNIANLAELLHQAYGTSAAVFAYTYVLLRPYQLNSPLSPSLALQALQATRTYLEAQANQLKLLTARLHLPLANIIHQYTQHYTLPSEFIADPSVDDIAIKDLIQKGLLSPASGTTSLDFSHTNITINSLSELLRANGGRTLKTLRLNAQNFTPSNSLLSHTCKQFTKLKTIKISSNPGTNNFQDKIQSPHPINEEKD